MWTKVRKKAVIMTAVSILTLGNLAVLSHVVQAADGTSTKDLVIHKIKNGDAPIHENDGNTRPDSLLGDYLIGAGFTIVEYLIIIMPILPHKAVVVRHRQMFTVITLI